MSHNLYKVGSAGAQSDGSITLPLEEIDGVLQEDAQEAMIYNLETGELDPQGYQVAPVSFAGIAWALASRDIPDEGGELMVEDGKVYVDNNADGAGIICPLPHDQETRLAGSLVMVHIR